MKFANTLLLFAAFGTGMLVDRQLVRREVLESSSWRNGPTASPPSLLGGRRMPGDSKMGREPQDTAADQRQRPFVQLSLMQLLAESEEDDMRDAVHHASAMELKQLLAECASIDSADPQVRLLKRALYEAWARQEPKQALTAALSESDRRLQEEVVHVAFERLARDDLTAARLAFQQLSTRRHREEAIGAMVGETALTDMAQVADFLPSGHHEQFYEGWAERDPVSAVAHAEATGQRTDVLRAIAHRWANQAPAEALQWAQTQDAQVMIGAMHALAEQDPAQAAALLAQMPPNHETSDLARQVAHQWSQDDLPAALAWSDTLTGSMRTEAFQELSHQSADSDPHNAAAFALSLERGEARERALFEVAHVWARENVDQALRWAQSLGGEETISAMRGLIETVSHQNPQTAAELLTQMAGQDRAYQELIGDVAGQWSEFQPKAAAAWAESLPAG